MNHKIEYFLLLFNFSILITNIFIFKNNKEYFSFKSSDQYIFINKSNYYKNIPLNDNNKLLNTDDKKKISIICKDTLDDIDCSRFFKNQLEQFNYIVDINNKNPDYLIFDVFGCEHIDTKYNNSIKIARFSENIIPDFSKIDYSLSHAHILYLDRNFKYPSFIWRLNNLRSYQVKNIESFSKNKKKKNFVLLLLVILIITLFLD